MKPNPWIEGRETTLEEVLDNREKRRLIQIQLLESYPSTLISFSLNIPGPLKHFPLSHRTFQEGKQEIVALLAGYGCSILTRREIASNAGYSALFAVSQDAVSVKMQMLSLEETHPLGRLFDIDVFSGEHVKISRSDYGKPERTCFLCGKPAFLCGRSRSHPVELLFQKAVAMMSSYFISAAAGQIGGLFTKAMIYEVSTTPKPGLVDRWHNGAHTDMDISLFMDSIGSLTPYFDQCSMLGAGWQDPTDLPGLFQNLRLQGLDAEKSMKQATHGVNTHKGLIFSGGILCAAAAYTYAATMTLDPESISQVCRDMLTDLHKDFSAIPFKTNKSHGDALYLKYGLMGIRKEAMEGFPIALKIGLPVFLQAQLAGCLPYQCGRIALLYLIAASEDTNIVARSSYRTWRNLQDKLSAYLSNHPLADKKETELIQKLDTYFVENHISPGGSADLLAVVYFFFFLQRQTI